jgi:hypothetical protein
MLNTTNLSLQKPEPLIDNVNIGVLNDNMDAIDSALGNTAIFETASGTETDITLTGITLSDGRSKTFIVAANNNGAGTTINGKPLYKPGTTTAPKLIAGKAVTIWYNGTNFFIKASAEGDSVVGNVLAGKTFSNDDDTGLTGTMPNNGPIAAETINLTTEGAEYTIPAGYHSGLRKIKAAITGLIASVIKAGVTVGGTLGTFTSDATAVDTNVLGGKTYYRNGAKGTGTMIDRSAENPHQIPPGLETYSGTIYATVPQGYFSGASFLKLVDPDFAPPNFLATTNMFGLQGAIPLLGDEEYSGWRRADVYQSSIDGRIHLRIPLGAYLTPNASQNGQFGVFYDDPDFIAPNILNTANIAGLQGTAVAGKRYASGTLAPGVNDVWIPGTVGGSGSSTSVLRLIVSGLAFKPRMVRAYLISNPNIFVIATDNPAETSYGKNVMLQQETNLPYLFKLDGTNIYMVNGGFAVPVKAPYTGNWQWEAWEE